MLLSHQTFLAFLSFFQFSFFNFILFSYALCYFHFLTFYHFYATREPAMVGGQSQTTIAGNQAIPHCCFSTFCNFCHFCIRLSSISAFCYFWHFRILQFLTGISTISGISATSSLSAISGNFDWQSFHCVYIDIQGFISSRAFYMDRIKVYVMWRMQCVYCFILQILTSKLSKYVGGFTLILTSKFPIMAHICWAGCSNVQSWTIINHYENSPEKHAKCTPRIRVSHLTIGLFLSISCIHSFASLIY